MKNISRTLIFLVVFTTLLVSACSGVPASMESATGGKGQASVVEYTGVIQAINGNQWTINNQIVTVDPALYQDGPFQVGDTVKVEVEVAQDGTVLVTRLELPSTAGIDNGNASLVNDNSNTNSISNSNEALGIVSSSNDNASQTLVFDDSGNEAFGSVDSISTDSVVIGGQTFALTNSSEFKGLIEAGAFVKIHFSLNADGTYSIVEIETWDPALGSNDNSNSNSNDDNSIGNSNDNDDDDDDNSNGNGNDDDDDDDNSNGNSNDDDDDDDDDDNSNGSG